MNILKTGTPVQVIQPPPITGKVVRMALVNDGKDLEYVIGYKGADGEEHERSFPADQLKEVGGAA